MLISERITTYWNNTKSMPFLLRLFCQGGMVAAPVLLFFLLLPITEWEINGRSMSYSELWSTGQGIAIAFFIGLVGGGALGLAARIRVNRWLLVSAPVARYLIFAFYPTFPSEAITPDIIISAVFTAVGIYVCLFRLRSVCEYIDYEGR